MLVDSRMFRGEGFVYNAGMSTASVEDYVAVWQSLKDQAKIPERVILFIDPWVLNRASGYLAWMTNSDFVERFRKSEGEGGWGPVTEIVKVGNDLAELFAWQTLKSSLKHVSARIRRPESVKKKEPWRLQAKAEVSMERSAWNLDGSRIYPRIDMRPKASATFRNGLEPDNFYSRELGNWAFSDDAYRLLSLLVADMRKSGARVLVVVPPFTPEWTSKVAKQRLYPAFKSEFFGALSRLSGQGLADEVCDAWESESFGCSREGFMDFMHLLRPCSQKLLEHCLAKQEGWKTLLSPEKAGWL